MIPKRLDGAKIGDILVFRDLDYIHNHSMTYGWNSMMDSLVEKQHEIVITNRILYDLENSRDECMESGTAWHISFDMLRLKNSIYI